MNEAEFIAALARLPLHPGADGLRDDAAILGHRAGEQLVLTKDMIVEGVHYLPLDPPDDVAWKLVAVNLSDLAAKGARPVGLMLGYMLGDDAWDRAFLTGLDEAIRAFDAPLLGGDTVRGGGRARTLSLTAIGAADRVARRGGAKAGDSLWVTGTIGDAGAGLRIAQGADGPESLRSAYRRPVPRIAEGRALSADASAMMDISDGLLIDASRMAAASGLAVGIDLDAVPLSDALRDFSGDDESARLAAVTAGDDYELLFALPGDTQPPVAATRIGRLEPGEGLTLRWRGNALSLPDRLGFQHGS
ncbi:thiamine-phosphate kinase [Stakelama pacifica]|uniref:Thiamine-monophosphate kinase n=1 Tax=Stakelama pacifica TaxID=517720 RepID=A0A4R6FMS1_9SPHN|nr:thiamine-phosphate kinase [Stakelama pacifica]TDN82300.1 thiamine-phosphate kinase [Stakelama pacifica]GGO95704.1 thiamine-monophosphate kinase [Stakelama pacifica]